MQKRLAGWGLVVGMAITGCASTHMYALPMSGAQAQSTFDPLVACAGARNMQTMRQDDGVDVKVEEGAFVRFAVDTSGNYAMGTMVEDSVPKSERNGKFDMLKSRGDELYACATQAGAAPQASTTPSGGGSMPQANANEACDRLDRCYTEISTSLCEAKDPHCKDHFHNKVQGDATACQMTLEHLPMMIAPMKKAKPNWQMPTVCMQQTGNGGQSTASTAPVGSMNWTGNWMAKVNYSYACTVPMSKPENGSDTGSWSMTISGANSQLAAQVNTSPSGYSMNGSGSDKSMRLCGAFPLKGKGQAPQTHDNNVCIVVSQMNGPNSVSGTVEGEFSTMAASCKVKEARVELTR